MNVAFPEADQDYPEDTEDVPAPRVDKGKKRAIFEDKDQSQETSTTPDLTESQSLCSLPLCTPSPLAGTK